MKLEGINGQNIISFEFDSGAQNESIGLTIILDDVFLTFTNSKNEIRKIVTYLTLRMIGQEDITHKVQIDVLNLNKNELISSNSSADAFYGSA